MANFPLATWQVTAPAAVWTEGGSGPSPGINAATGKWGFDIASTSTKAATVDSVPGYLADEINALGAGIIVAAIYVYTDGTNPATSPLFVNFVYQCGSGGTLTFADLDAAAVYGFASTTVTFAPTPGASFGTVQTTYNGGGVWVPCGVAGDLRRTTRQRAAASSSDMSGVSTDVVNWGEVADLEFLSSVFPAGNLTRWFAATQIYATAAGRNVADPNNTLEGMLQAAATGVTFRLYRQAATTSGTTPTTYVEAKMPTISSKSSAEDYTSAVDEPRLWSTAGLILRGST
jgi:hypothetical protein